MLKYQLMFLSNLLSTNKIEISKHYIYMKITLAYDLID